VLLYALSGLGWRHVIVLVTYFACKLRVSKLRGDDGRSLKGKSLSMKAPARRTESVASIDAIRDYKFAR
jgi:hypothetical protein